MHSLWLFLAGFVLLIAGGEYLVKAAVSLALKLNLSRIVIGMTVVSFATSVPELIVSITSALRDHPDIALSNVIGSNIANIGLVLGFTALLIPIWVKRQTYRYNWPAMMLISVLFYFFLVNDFRLSRIEGLVLFVFLVLFIVFIVRQSYLSGDAAHDEFDEELHQIRSWRVFFWLVIGGFLLWWGSRLLVEGAVDLARVFGVSERLIGISLVAVGTSIPELAASVISAYKQEKDISLGNLIGSNIFNIGSVIGLTAIIKPINHFARKLTSIDVYWMLAVSFLVVPLALLPPKNYINRWKGILFLLLYSVFIYIAFFQRS